MIKKIVCLILAIVLGSANYLNGQSIQRDYDPIGRLTEIIYPDSSIITFTYDNNGNLLSKQTHDPCDTKPKPIITPLGAVVFCHEDTLQLTTEPALQYHWSTGDTTQTIKVIATGNYSVTVIDSFKVFEDTLQCQLSSDSIAIYVKPLPDLTPITDQIVCNGDTSIHIAFNSTLDSTVFNWVGSNSLIGLSQTGSGDIPSFAVINTGNTTIVDTIIVTPFRNDCYGKPDTFTITVHPTPILDTISDQVICNGLNSTAVPLNSSVAGTQFAWTNNDTSIGLVANGNNSIPSFTTLNLTNTPVIATISVVGTYSGCSSINENFTITVNPTPDIDSIPNQVLCNGASTTVVNFAGTVNGSVFSWTNNKTSIGLAAGGTGTIPAFTGNNSTNLPVIASINVTPSANQCTGQQKSFTITVNPTPSVNNISNQAVCNGGNAGDIIFSGSVSGTAYNWSNNKPSIGLSSSGVDSIPSFIALNFGNTPVIAGISVTPTVNNCPGQSKGFTITVNPTPTVNTVTSQSLCNDANTAPINFTGSVSNATYHWSNNNYTIGLDSVGTGNIGTFQAINTGYIFANATVTVVPKANNCTGLSKKFTITVKPTPTIDSVAGQVVCNGDTTNTIVFTGSVVNSVYTWSNNNTAIGLGMGGTDSIPAFIATNFSSTPGTALITTTTTANGCNGQPKSFSILVNPTPSVNVVSNFTYCNGDMLQAIPFSGSVSGTTFGWINSGTSIGLSSTGTNTINSFTVKNLTTIPTIANIMVTPEANNCSGQSKSFNITVNPTPNVVPTTSQILCNGDSTDSVNFIGSVANTLFHWTNSDTNIGLADSGTGSIPSFTGNNTVTYPLIGLIEVQPVANSCTGLADTFTIKINPTPNVLPLPDITVCNTDSAHFSNFGGYVWGTTYKWENNNSSIGLADTGTGNLPTFAALNDSNVLISAFIEITPWANNCSGAADTLEIFIKPTPVLDSIINQEVCNNAPSDSIVYTSSVAGTTFSTWSDNLSIIGFSGAASQGIPSFSVKNNTDTQVIARIRILPTANSCIGLADTFTITANPTPYIDTIVSQLLCENDSTSYIEFKGNVASSVFNWINTDTTIGLTNADTGNIDKFKALNPFDSLRTATVSVTATAFNCAGPTRNFTIWVKPKPAVDAVSDFTLCNKNLFSTLTFLGPVSNTRFQWTNSDTSIGLARIGMDSVEAFNAVNSTNTPIVSIITVAPTADNCTGDSMDFRIRVNPTPTLDTILSYIYCNGETTSEVIFNSSVDSTTYSWINSDASIGLPSIGTNNIQTFVATNIDSAQSESIISVTPMAYGCVGLPRDFSIKVNPTLVPDIYISSRASGVICDGISDTFTATIVNGGSNPNYTWKINGIIYPGDSNQFVATSLSNGDVISCELSSNATCAKPPKVSSNLISMTVNPNLVPIVNLMRTPGIFIDLWEDVEFSTNVINGGSSPTYQWQKNGEDIGGAMGTKFSGKAGVNLLPGDIICVKIKSNEPCLAVDTAISCERAITISDIDKGTRLDLITLLPNPNNGNFILQGNVYTDRQIEVKVLTASGKLTYTTAIIPINNTVYSEIQLDDYPNGVYFLWLILGEDIDSKTIRFVISR